MTVLITLPSRGDAKDIYYWHHGFASANAHVSTRARGEMKRLCERNCVIAAKTNDDEYIALGYYRQRGGRWVVGGLICAVAHRGNSVPMFLAYIAIAKLIVENRVIERSEPIVSHVKPDNLKPVSLLTSLGFTKTRPASPEEVLLTSEEVGDKASSSENFDEYELTNVGNLKNLVHWCREWSGELPNGRAVQLDIGLNTLDEISIAIEEIIRDKM